MEEKILAAIIGFVTGAIASVLAPWVNWGIEKKRKKLEYRQQLVKDWRKMVVRIQTAYESPESQQIDMTFYEMLERDPDFLSLEPRLNNGEKDILKKSDRKLGVVQIVTYSVNIHRIDPIDQFIAALRYRIGKIEEEWDII